MQIAMLSLHSCPLGRAGEKDTGGMNVYIRELSRELSRKGHSIDIFTNSHPAEHDSIIKLADSVNLIHLEAGTPKEMPKIALYSYLEKFAVETDSYTQRNNIKYDFIFSHYWLSGLLGIKLQNIWQIPHMSMFHTLGAIKNSIGGSEPPLRIEGEKRVARESGLIIASTDREKRYLADHYSAPPERISIIPCGVNLDLFRPVDKQAAKSRLNMNGNKIVLYVGRLEPLKGIENLIAAFELLKNNASLHLIIVGGDNNRNDDISAMQKLAAGLSIENRITFTGSLSQNDLPLYYNAADMCVIPSYYESFGLVGLEALACGTPLITTDVGDMKNIITSPEIGRIIVDNNPETIAVAIKNIILTDQSQRDGREIRRHAASHYSWGTVTNMVLGAFPSLADAQCEKAPVTSRI